MTSPSDASSRASRGFEGEVAGLGLTDIIQINARNGFSGSIRVQNGDARGVIFFREGDIVHAEQGHLTGEEAFYEIVAWQGGRFSVETNVVTALRTLQKRCEHLLLDAHRVLDERRARGLVPQPAPSAPRKPGVGSSVDLARGVPGVANAVLITRAGARIGSEGYESEVLGGQTLFLGLFGAELGAAFDAGELRSASVEGSKRHLLLYNSKTLSLGVFATPDADVGSVDAAVRAALSKGK
jgi:predicted regulator of Ras-like GTPase activity (Roadblock/LC7/MglB family)